MLCKRLSKIVIGILILFVTDALGSDPVQFADNELKKAIEYRLKITDPTREDMLNLEWLNLNNRQIKDFEGIQYGLLPKNWSVLSESIIE